MKRTRFESGNAVVLAAVAIGLLTAPCQMGVCQEGDTVADMVDSVLTARGEHRQIPYLSETFGPFSVADAYRVQSLTATKLTERLGPVVGYKGAYASYSALETYGLDSPGSAPVFLLQRTPTGTTISSDVFNMLVLETEVAFTFGRRVDRQIPNIAALKDYVKSVHSSFEICHVSSLSSRSRWTARNSCSWTIT